MNKILLPIMVSFLLVFAGNSTAGITNPENTNVVAKKGGIASASVLAFGPNDVLFVGDSKAGAIVAFELESATPADADKVYYNIPSIDKKIAAALGVKVDEISITDLAIHPTTKEAYLAVSRGLGDNATPVIVVVQTDGRLSTLNLDKLQSTKVTLSDAPTSDYKFWDKIPLRSFTVTDMEFHNGELLVAGLSNEDFSSTFRRIEYPFNENTKVVSSSTEIYHAVHNQNETRAPIRTFKIVDLEGEDYVLASYTCTPLVLIPLSAMKDGAHVKGKTIAELGFGNTPIDILSYTVTGRDGKSQDLVLITHNERVANLIDMKDLVKSASAPAVSTPSFDAVGTPSRLIPVSGVLHVDNLNSNLIVALKRTISTGELNLDSYPKGWYLKLSQFIVEYDYPGYEYPADGSQDHIEQGHKAIIPMEGYDFKTRKPLNKN